MKRGNSILVAFVLNLLFALFEFTGGIMTGSVAVVSDAVHDLGDAISIGISWLLERKSLHPPDRHYTYGYGRYSVIGGAVTTLILLIGSATVIYNAILRIINPTPIHYDGMLLMACIGITVNFIAAWFTRKGDSMNQKAVNLHMLEDVLGWLVVLVGALVMRFTDLSVIDPLISIGVALFIGFHAWLHLRQTLDVVLERVPHGMDAETLTRELEQLENIQNIHHLHLWTLDGNQYSVTLHAVTDDPQKAKASLRQRLKSLGIEHVTIETETPQEHCHHQTCTHIHRH